MGFEGKDGNSRYSGSGFGVSNSKASENNVVNSNHEDTGGVSSRRKHNKGSHKQPSSLKQRFFSNNFRNHGTGRSLGVVSESPPSNSVGYFFGSTPPENHGLVENTISSAFMYIVNEFSLSPYFQLASYYSPYTFLEYWLVSVEVDEFMRWLINTVLFC